jgi:cysteine-S-conjugate beta-lyase
VKRAQRAPGYDATVAHTPAGSSRLPLDDGLDELDEAWLRSKPGAKWARAGAGVIPSWIADMDFPTPRPVRDALVALAEGGDLGYSSGTDMALLEEKWAARMATRYGWAPDGGHFRLFCDVVQAVQVAVDVTTSPGDGILLLTPSYPPLWRAIEDSGRRLLAVPALEAEAGWPFDLDLAEEQAGRAKLLLLANPHNPTGRVLSRLELLRLGDLVERHNLLVVADEVHADLVLTGGPHIPFASLSGDLGRRTVTLYSASKSYNLGGMRCAVAYIGPAEMERRLASFPSELFGRVSVAALVSTLASWTKPGDEWLDRCLARLRANRDIMAQWLTGAGAEAGVHGSPSEGTYLQWLDFRPAGLSDDPAAWLLENAKVMMGSGPHFGPGGPGFARLNFATTPAVLEEVLSRVHGAITGAEPSAALNTTAGTSPTVGTSRVRTSTQ